ncbi:MAG: ATP-binding cassette domain-containing protein [Sphingobacterium sp.]
MIHIDDLAYGYAKQRKIICDINCSLEPGKVYGLLGLNGEGKTTLIKLIAGLLFPRKGSIQINGQESSKRGRDFFDQVFYVSDTSNLPSLNVSEFGKGYGKFYSGFSEQQFADNLQSFNITPHRNLNSLSLGQNRKVHLAFALACNTSVLLMDEPTNGLDIPSKSVFRRLVAKSISDHKIFIISTHQIRDVDNLLDHLLLLKDGSLLLDKNLYDLSQEYRVVHSLTGDEEVVYQLDQIQGTSYLIKNNSGSESALDIEFLFNAFNQNNQDVTV